jgi:formylmethanofuran dehydrogenase subunit E
MLSYPDAVNFHGHDGPLLALGFRAGKLAIEELEPEGIMGMECTIETSFKKPFTCVVDGVQTSTYCTLGKGILKFVDTGNEKVKMIFRNSKTNQKIEIIIKDKIMEKALKAEDLEKEVIWVNGQPDSSLFEIKSA